MANSAWISLILTFCQALALNFSPRPPNAPNRFYWHELGSVPNLRRTASLHMVRRPSMLVEPAITLQHEHSIQRRGSPYLLLRPMNVNDRPKTSRRLVLTLPKDNIQILNAEALGETGSQILPTTLTLSLGNTGTDHNGNQFSRYAASRGYVPHGLPRQESRFHYGVMADSDEEEKPKGRWSKGEVSYELDDLDGSSGGHVTVIKGHPGPPTKFLSARKVKATKQSPLQAMKAIIIQPKEIQAKRIRVVKTTAEKVTPMKGRFVKAGEPMLTTAMKAKVHPASFKKAIISKDKGEVWAASNVHYLNAEPPQDAVARHQEERLSSMADLQCGGSNDLGWCDLGNNYPSTEVSQIMEMCEELLSRMYVEVPSITSSMEDIASYSLSRNVTQNPYWPWKEPVATLKKNLCPVQKDVIQPSFAQDIRGKWHVIIQTQAFPQRIVLEVCRKPGEICELCKKSVTQCVQKYSHHQLISFDPESAETCPYVRLYKFPTSCVCRIAE